MRAKNQFLLEIGLAARTNRVPYWNDDATYSVRITETPAWTDAGLWFRTAGCTYDAHGGCLMCDYSNGPKTDASHMVSYVEAGLKQIPSDSRILLVSPSGSMLDEQEVPRPALEGILRVLSRSSHQFIAFETRAETITDEVIDLCKTYLKDRFYGLYVGLESVSPFILKHCINKQLQLRAVEKALQVGKKHNVKIRMNVIVGAPYLTINENIQETVRTVSWALNKGAARSDLFPIHVKSHTPLYFLQQAGLYTPPSFWTLVEILNKLGEEHWSQVGLSWYSSYGAYNVVASPTTCDVCVNEMLEHLSGFAENHAGEFITKMNSISCTCRARWRDEKKKVSTPLPERVIYGYRKMSEKLMGNEWWQANAGAIKTLVNNDWEEGGELSAV
jgi:radical SAM enzyme (TIGR01210 family)